MSNDSVTAHGATAGETSSAEQDDPLSPPKTQHDTSPATSPFLMQAAATDGNGSSPIKIKKKGRFTVKTTAVDNNIIGGGVDNTTPKAKETRTTQPANAAGKVKLRPHPNMFSPDKPHTPDVDNYDAFGLNLVADTTERIIPEALLRRTAPLKRTQSCDSYISDDSSSSAELDDFLDDEDRSPDRRKPIEASLDISMTYSPEHPHLVGKLLNQSPGKRSHVTFDEATIDPDTAAHNNSGSDENIVHLVGRNSKESLSLCNSESVSSSLGGGGTQNEQVDLNNNPKPQDNFEFVPRPEQQQQHRSSSAHVISNAKRPTLQMRCNSALLFSSKSASREANNLNTNTNNTEEGYTRNNSATYSSDSSEVVDEDLPVMPSGRNAPFHTSLDTPTPTQADGARQFYANQQSAQKVAELQAITPLAHRPYLDYDEKELLFTESLTQQFSNSNTDTLSNALCNTDEDDRDHMYWRSFPDLAADDLDLHPSRWAMLFYLSLLNLLSGWICFSVAPVATMLEGDVDAESLVSLFLISSAVATFFAPATLSRLGRRRTVLLGALLLLVGLKVCCASQDFVEKLPIGFVIAGLSQPLYQITPVFVVTAWFPPNDHTAMLRIVLKSNQLGVLLSFLCGSFLVSSENDILPYFQCISLIATILFIAMAFHFEAAPPTPPTNKVFKESKYVFRQRTPDELNGDLEKETNDPIVGNHTSAKMDFVSVYTEQLKEEKGHRVNFSYGSIEPSSPFPHLQGSFTPRGNSGQLQQILSEQQDADTPRSHETTILSNQVLATMKACFSKEGFTRCSIAFVTYGVVANSLLTFMVYLVGASGSNKIHVGAIGGAFQLFIMISPFVVDKWTDPSHRHSLLSASYLAGAVALVLCMISMEWESFAGLISSLLAVALIVGSSQTLSIGRGIEISQMSENSVLIIFRLLSNTLSAAAIPLFRLLRSVAMAKFAPEFSLPFIMLIAMNMITATCFFGGNRCSSSNAQQQTEIHPFLPRTSV